MDIKALQQESQRNLGRCMMRLQQYEGLLKVMVANMAVEGPLALLQAEQERQQAEMRNRTLGMLIAKFTGDHLTVASSEIGSAPEEGRRSSNRSSDVAWARMHFTISMSPELHAQTTAGMSELVEMRNDLVHHLIDRFDLSSENGCRAASTHLESCYNKIDAQFHILRDWAMSLAMSQTAASSYARSREFENAFVNGINPDGSVCWQRSSIVEFLRGAEAACQVAGWTSLHAAIQFISKENRDHTPSRYGCKTWRQILKKSGQFEIRIVPGSDGAMGHTWYRSRT